MASILERILSNDLAKVAIIVVLALIAFHFYKEHFETKKEGMDNTVTVATPATPAVAKQTDAPVVQGQQATQGAPVAAEHAETAQLQSIVAGRAQLTADDLLPKYDDANEFAKQNPVSNLLKEQNFLISGYHAGINTVMQSNKIPYHDLRSAPPIPKEYVGPWNQSTYEAQPQRRNLEIL
jgi:hypothetical protein